ncbi:S-adenosyl-L-methionine-dependent methyltransferase [Aspergillus granulosus]|uniref:S-adenosyl-L-methionine-dependent methyltransferase n=1 Tax=Aspergillus granulosus TaxID=176169 RepID=A0ABR4HVA7_9EURO
MTTYTTNHAPSVLATHSWRTAQNSAAYLIPHLTPSMKILDIGCGPGSITIDLALHIPQGHITGLEYVEDPLPGARELAASLGVKNITFATGDIQALPFEDNTFDVVHVHQVLQHIADPVLGLREMRRVVKPGGIVAARESDSFSWFPQNTGIENWLKVTSRVAKAKGGNPHPGRMIHVWAREAGFDVEKVKRSSGAWCFSEPEEREYWGGGMARRMEESGFVDLALGEGGITKEELEGIVHGWREWVAEENGWFGVLHGEVLCWK